jgi:hypothetical protein
MRRAVVVYLEDKNDLMLQFGCLYTSLKHIQSKDTDLVVFGTQEALNKVPNDCKKIQSEPVSYRKEWHNHHYINSINCLVSRVDSDILDEYDYLLRSDVDTFLTPAWNSYYPDSYTVGHGAYIYSDEVRENIRKISTSLSYKHRGIHNIGSTHYGDPRSIREVCRLTLAVTHHILNHEFKDGPGVWPGWYKGVSILYGNEIAVNHLIEDVCLDYGNLDFFSTSLETIFQHSHIHCWHTDDMFSKFKFVAGQYDDLSTDNLNVQEVRDYCLYIALKSKREMPWLG